MTTQHTPGPWETDEYGNEITAGNLLIGRAHTSFSASAKEKKQFKTLGYDEVETAKANAHLIAAAPDLLAALDKVNTVISTYGIAGQPAIDAATGMVTNPLLQEIRDAIAKATGKQ